MFNNELCITTFIEISSCTSYKIHTSFWRCKARYAPSIVMLTCKTVHSKVHHQFKWNLPCLPQLQLSHKLKSILVLADDDDVYSQGV